MADNKQCISILSVQFFTFLSKTLSLPGSLIICKSLKIKLKKNVLKNGERKERLIGSLAQLDKKNHLRVRRTLKELDSENIYLTPYIVIIT